MVYEHPLAYLLGLEGVALLRSFTGEHDREFVAARIAEVRRLIDDGSLADAAVEAERVDTVTGYRTWSRTYDDGRNSAFDFDEPVVEKILDGLPAGTAVDAACGTGRFAEILAGRGHRVVGVDSSPEMLERARERVPEGEFSVGDLTGLPVGDATADLVVCALALTHVPSLGPVFAEFARVLRPGGHLVISDMHPGRVMFGSVPTVRDAEGKPGRLVSHRHEIGDYLRVALPLGLQVRGFEEPALPGMPASGPAAAEPGPWDLWPWSLAAMVPEAAAAASADMPATMIWHFQLDDQE
ncbi:class I SAM-dependent methyltransferase [Saccharopolyspora sp. NPDC002686]|uniref:class I SAM-dependent methyltransferase n=1 Tax=Saccharopolyspora sp. NPDC002686 TaxID=3154541 RepID=UPI0033254FE1